MFTKSEIMTLTDATAYHDELKPLRDKLANCLAEIDMEENTLKAQFEHWHDTTLQVVLENLKEDSEIADSIRAEIARRTRPDPYFTINRWRRFSEIELLTMQEIFKSVENDDTIMAMLRKEIWKEVELRRVRSV